MKVSVSVSVSVCHRLSIQRESSCMPLYGQMCLGTNINTKQRLRFHVTLNSNDCSKNLQSYSAHGGRLLQPHFQTRTVAPAYLMAFSHFSV